MSSTIWTPAALASEAAVAELALWRAVEAQHVVATRALVDSLAEQELLHRCQHPDLRTPCGRQAESEQTGLPGCRGRHRLEVTCQLAAAGIHQQIVLIRRVMDGES